MFSMFATCNCHSGGCSPARPMDTTAIVMLVGIVCVIFLAMALVCNRMARKR